MTGPIAAAFRTPEQVAQRTGLSRKAIYRAIERGELTAYRLCGRLRIHLDDEQQWIEHNRVKPAVSDVPDLDRRPRPAAPTHSLRHLLEANEKSTGLAGQGSYDATPDSNSNAPATVSTSRARHQGATP